MLVVVDAGVEVEQSRFLLQHTRGFQDIHAQLNLIAQHHQLHGHQTKESTMMLIALKCIYNLMEGPLGGVTAQPRSQSSNL